MALQSAFGLIALAAIAMALGERGSGVSIGRRLKIAGVGIAVQISLALVLLKLPPVHQVFVWLNGLVVALQSAAQAGTGFVFGYLGGAALPFTADGAGSTFILAFQALPLILIMSALSALLFYWGALPWLVGLMSRILKKTLGIGGAVSLSAAANVFVGMVEAPLLIRPFVARLSRSELFMVMACGMATIAGTMFVLYATVLAPVIPDALGHLLAASLISAPAAITVARLMVPDASPPTDGGIDMGERPHGAMDAVVRGTLDGVALLINVIAMLIVLVALVHLVNITLGLIPDIAGEPLSLQRLLGWALAPIAWLMGLPWAEATTGGSLLGVKIVLNELVAYLDMAGLPDGTLSPRSELIMTYGLCGFANFGSLGIMIGGLATIAPERRAEIVGLGFKSIVAGTLAACMTGAVVGMI